MKLAIKPTIVMEKTTLIVYRDGILPNSGSRIKSKNCENGFNFMTKLCLLSRIFEDQITGVIKNTICMKLVIIGFKSRKRVLRIERIRPYAKPFTNIIKSAKGKNNIGSSILTWKIIQIGTKMIMLCKNIKKVLDNERNT